MLRRGYAPRRGNTLVEALIALSLFGLVGAAIASASLHEQRVLDALARSSQSRAQVDAAVDALAASLLAIDAADIVGTTRDSAVEIESTLLAGLACAASASEVVVAIPTTPGTATLGTANTPPENGDDIRWLAGTGGRQRWHAGAVTGAARSGNRCDGSDTTEWRQPASARWIINLVRTDSADTPPAVGDMVLIRRRARWSLYKASDKSWWLGWRGWNGALGRFDVIQPVAGPLAPYSSDPSKTGFHLSIHDSTDAPLALPLADPSAARRIEVTARSPAPPPSRDLAGSLPLGFTLGDSAMAVIALRSHR
ncbi:MAG: hypothetical protein JWO05_3736 [Gemmatimonadetes bacterium]|nr:hypothetical protein [Gemmatimonadota bacterium]